MEIIIVLIISAVAVTAVLLPLLRGTGGKHDPELDEPGATPARRHRSVNDVEQQIQLYRTALVSRTVCMRCGRANPAGSRFCAECGRRLPAARRIRGRIKRAS